MAYVNFKFTRRLFTYVAFYFMFPGITFLQTCKSLTSHVY